MSVGPLTSVVDARWLMAFSAALGERDARCYGTGRAAGAPISTTVQGSLFRGVEQQAGQGSPEDPPAIKGNLTEAGRIAVSATLAHVYTECARMWNPIHTDLAYARAAGLPGTILHGTATLARGTIDLV